MDDVVLCPFDRKRCSFPDGEVPNVGHIEEDDFVGCKVFNHYDAYDVVIWVCPRFPVNMSITAVRDAFMRLHSEKEHERKRMRQSS